MTFKKHSSGLDSIGMTASLLCAIHCAVVPLLVTILPLIGLGFLANPWIEWGMIIFALFIGIYAIGLSYFRIHHKPLPISLLIVGFLVIITGHLLIAKRREFMIVPIGGLLIAAAHFFNYRYTAVCQSGNAPLTLKPAHQ